MRQSQTEARFSQEVSWSPVIKKFGDSRFLSIFRWLCDVVHYSKSPSLGCSLLKKEERTLTSCSRVFSQSFEQVTSNEHLAQADPLLLGRGTEPQVQNTFLQGVLRTAGDTGTREQIITQCSEFLHKGVFPTVEELKSEFDSTL